MFYLQDDASTKYNKNSYTFIMGRSDEYCTRYNISRRVAYFRQHKGATEMLTINIVRQNMAMMMMILHAYTSQRRNIPRVVS